MRNEVHYEWCWEYSDEHGDIEDLNHGDTLKDLGAAWEDNLYKAELTLIRQYGNDADGMLEQGYAYPKERQLPEFFSCGARVPKRFQKELDEFKGEQA
tara:strand:- start:347 stop:640 length:294 start_codon:yes stop_codon:yes gene_type:complete